MTCMNESLPLVDKVRRSHLLQPGRGVKQSRRFGYMNRGYQDHNKETASQ